MIADALHHVYAGESLPRENARELGLALLQGEWSSPQVAALLVALRLKGETVDELTGFAEAMRERCTSIAAPADAIDTCGTGGDGGKTFNISTLAAFVLSGAGVPVAKHGNRSISSRCGSADLLEGMGCSLAMTHERAEAALRSVGLTFMFAPAFHPAMKALGPLRRELRVRTTFNVLGPLSNPAGVTHQVIGVFSPSLLRVFAETLRNLGSERALIVHGSDGMDELTTTGPTKFCLLDDGIITEGAVHPQEIGIGLACADELAGGDLEENLRIARSVLAGEKGPKRDIVVLNAAAGLFVAGKAPTIGDGVAMARESIDSGKAAGVAESLKEFSLG